ncbi:MAG: hypothetical protein M3P30_01395 [Chloroflexota bacterium]|nr:hypothetical protein [Chloroflexota bacterium]
MQLIRGERGESIMEIIGYLAVAGALAAVAWYFVVYDKERKLSPAEQAYVVAVATQRADAYIRAVATQQASASPPAAPIEPPASVAPVVAARPPAPPPAPLAPTAAAPPYVPPPAPTSAPPPPPPRTKPPMGTCVGYMAGLTSTGIDACQQLTADASLHVTVRNCIGDVINGSATTPIGKSDCVNAALHAGDANLSDCLLGLSGQSHFGPTSCKQYYGSV